jgi:hypothetical protein
MSPALYRITWLSTVLLRFKWGLGFDFGQRYSLVSLLVKPNELKIFNLFWPRSEPVCWAGLPNMGWSGAVVEHWSHDQEAARTIPGWVIAWFPYWSSSSQRFVATPWNPPKCSVDTGIITIAKCFVNKLLYHGKVLYKWRLFLLLQSVSINYVYVFDQDRIGWFICPYDWLILKEACVIDMFLRSDMPLF